MSLPNTASCILLCALVLSACFLSTHAQQKPKYLAIFTSNVNVDGQSYRKGCQMEALGLDRVSQKVMINDQGKTVKVPAAALKVLPEDKAGISIVDANFTTSNENPRNVAAKLQRKYDGQQSASFVVAGSDFGIRTTQSSMTTPPSGTGSSSGSSSRMPSPTGAGMGQGGPGNSAGMGQSGTLEIVYYYKGSSRTVSAAEGQRVVMP